MFTDDFYAYACHRVAEEAGAAGYTRRQMRILRECMEDGLIRGDYLLPESMMQMRKEHAEKPGEWNYWKTMTAIARVS